MDNMGDQIPHSMQSEMFQGAKHSGKAKHVLAQHFKLINLRGLHKARLYIFWVHPASLALHSI